MNIDGSTAIVTGASRGIGRAIAIKLAKSGIEVAVNYSKDADGAKKTVSAIKEFGGTACMFKADISSYKETQGLISDVTKAFGRIDILINNAGISKVGLFTDLKSDDIDEIIDVNLKGALNCSHCVLPQMISRKKGCIVNISSIWGNVGASCEVAYSCTKGGINAFTRALAKEMAPSKIRVNAVAPGVIDTTMNNNLTSEEKEDLRLEIPMERFGLPEDIANAVSFLCSKEADYITGQVLTVDGAFL